MIIPLLNSMLSLMMVKFLLNDMPHAVGLLDPQQQAASKWKEILKYCHTMSDLRKIASGTGRIYIYHGAPTAFADAMVKSGPNVPYRAEDTARYVADLYGISYRAFARVAYRRHDVVTRLSAATAPVAARWAWSFPLGEILTEFNAQARMYLASKKLSLERGISVDNAYDELSNRAIEIGKETGQRYSSNVVPDLLGLPDKIGTKMKTGALVQIEVDASVIGMTAQHDAKFYLKDVATGETTAAEVLMFWNHGYRDFLLEPENVKSMRVVVRDMQPGEQDIVEEMIREGKLSTRCGQ